MIGRRHFVTGAIATLTPLIGTPGRVRAADAFRLIVTETETPLVPNSVTLLAQSLGYFKKAGVDVEIVRVQQTPSAGAALRSGQGDMANISTDPALQLVGRDQMRLRGVISPDKALPFIIVAKKAIAKPKDLNGKIFGVARIGSVDYEMSRIVLEKLGVDVDKLRYLALGQPPVRVQSLLAGQIDATTISIGVWTTLPDKSGHAVLVDQSDYHKHAPFVTKLNVVTDEVAKAKPKEVQAVVRALMMASRDFANKPELWVNAMVAARPDVKRQDLEVLATAYRKSWSVNGGLNVEAIKFTTAALYRSPDLKDVRRVEPAEWIDTSFIDAVLKSAGIERGSDEPGR